MGLRLVKWFVFIEGILRRSAGCVSPTPAPLSSAAMPSLHLTKGFIHLGRIDKAMDLLREMLNKRQGADSIVYNNLIFEFLNLGNLEKANVVLLKYGKKSEAWALFERIKFSKAIDTFDKIEMHLKSKAFIMDVAGYNNIITQFCENEMLDEAEKLLGEMPTKILPQNTTDFGLDFSKDVIDQMMRASVGITPALHNFVSKAFGQVGRGEKIDRVLNMDRNNIIYDCKRFIAAFLSHARAFAALALVLSRALAALISKHKVAAEVVAAPVTAAVAESMEAKISKDTYAAY
ncbi:hypothetical protein JRO89_XS03G0053900 [Xanthoceras sorbifolium]|uniref:Pentatricopeptide repeat-containing protein n=1 Tax=Xanthoceras sorbifolium TaxID=99658 RepID=A0ABQ8I9C2_9ROSI|nr:hypothetical protein JRO89_XS03G0053900 [Xanthoceras sorbifolium]